jgi:hypothetical protein
MSWTCLRCEKQCVGTRFCSTDCSEYYVQENKLLCSKPGCIQERNYIKHSLLQYCTHHNQKNVEELGKHMERMSNKHLSRLRLMSAEKVEKASEQNLKDKRRIIQLENTNRQLKESNNEFRRKKQLQKRQLDSDPLDDVMVTVPKKSRYFEIDLDEYLKNAKPTL